MQIPRTLPNEEDGEDLQGKIRTDGNEAEAITNVTTHHDIQDHDTSVQILDKDRNILERKGTFNQNKERILDVPEVEANQIRATFQTKVGDVDIPDHAKEKIRNYVNSKIRRLGSSQ